MKKKTRKIAKQLGATAGIVGGVAAAGYAAAKLLRKKSEGSEPGLADATGADDEHMQSSGQVETPEEMNLRDAKRAQDFEPGSNFDYGSTKRDIVGDPSARTSVGLENEPAQGTGGESSTI